MASHTSSSSQENLGKSPCSLLALFIADFSRCFILALIYTLVAFPISSYFGGPAELASKPLFSPNPFISGSEAMLAIQIISTFVVLGYFAEMARSGLPLYARAFGDNPSLVRLILVSSLPVLVFGLTTIIFSIFFAFQGGAFANALLIYTHVSVWPFVVVVPIAGLISGLTRPLPRGCEPAEVREALANLRAWAKHLPNLIDRVTGVLEPVFQGNIIGASLAGLSATAFLAAGISDDPVVFILLFVLPTINAIGDYPVFILCDYLRRIKGASSSAASKVFVISISLYLGLLSSIFSAFFLFIGALVVNDWCHETAIPWRAYAGAALDDPFGKGIVVTMMLLSPMIWVCYNIFRSVRSGGD